MWEEVREKKEKERVKPQERKRHSNDHAESSAHDQAIDFIALYSRFYSGI